MWLALLLIAAPTPAWRAGTANLDTLESRFPPPTGAVRVALPPASFGAWLRRLPLLDGKPDVLLFDGSRKEYQSAQAAVFAIDVGERDLQQCADAVMRLRAEYLWASDKADEVCFASTSGQALPWSRYRMGERPVVTNDRVQWRPKTKASSDYASFRRYLDVVFGWAGTLSLAREVVAVADPNKPMPGDLYIRGGSPGHAVIVVDAADDAQGQRYVLLAQSYMPAQQIHVLVNPLSPNNPWYRAAATGSLQTPEWLFQHQELRRFAPAAVGACGEGK